MKKKVFLRVLEYYRGILFLTTNRVGKMDEAFRSRVHITLYYPPLELKSTLDIFNENIRLIKQRKVYPIRIKEEEIRTFAEDHYEYSDPRTRWNGRQIRNAFHIAVALAENEAIDKKKPRSPVLRSRHFDLVEQASTRFDDYMTSVLGMTQSDRAMQRSILKDNWEAGFEERRVRDSAPISMGVRRRAPRAHQRRASKRDDSSSDDNAQVTENDATDRSDSERGPRRRYDDDDDEGSEDQPTQRERRRNESNREEKQEMGVKYKGKEPAYGGRSSRKRSSRGVRSHSRDQR